MFDNLHISQELSNRMVTVFNDCVTKRKQCHTQQEMAEFMGVSRKSIVEFEQGKFNFELFEGYSGMFGYEIHIFLK